MPSELSPVILLASASGLRCSELLALRRADLDFHANTIVVEEANDQRTAGNILGLSEFPEARPPLGYCPQSPRPCCEDMGILGVMDLYNLRNTFAPDRFCPGLMSRFCRKFSDTRKSV